MEQRWQDLANLLSFPPAMGMADMSSHAAAAHYSSHYPYHQVSQQLLSRIN
jgi:hypothetical protein